MRYSTPALATIVFLLFACTAEAQQPDRQGHHPMGQMEEGMKGAMQQMMQSPMHRSMMMVNVLPTMQETLGFSDEQAQQLRGMQENLKDQMQNHQGRMMEMHQQMQDRFQEEEMPSSEQMREHFGEMAQLHADAQALQYETYMRMNDALTDEQRQQLAQMEPQQMHRHMMQNMSMEDMMQMMRGGMMGAGMMPMMKHHRGKGMNRQQNQ